MVISKPYNIQFLFRSGIRSNTSIQLIAEIQRENDDGDDDDDDDDEEVYFYSDISS